MNRSTLLLGSLLAGLLVAEGAVRAVELVTGSSYALQIDAHFDKPALFQPHPYVGYILTPGSRSDENAFGQFSVNAMGFRGKAIRTPKPPRTFRVACLGGSTTYGTPANDDDHTWPALLEQSLNAARADDGPYDRIEIINAGVSGYTVMESFVNFKMRVMPLEPDLVILYHGINDGRVMGRRDFQPDYSHVRMPWVRPIPSRADVLFGWSHLYGLIRGKEALPTLEDAIAKPYLGERLTGDELVPGLVTWRRTLTELTSMARGNDVAVMLTSFAYTREHHLRKKWMVAALQIVDAMNEITKEVAHDNGALFADLSGAVGTRRELYVDTVHLTNEGNRLIAEELSRVIANSSVLGGERVRLEARNQER